MCDDAGRSRYYVRISNIIVMEVISGFQVLSSLINGGLRVHYFSQSLAIICGYVSLKRESQIRLIEFFLRLPTRRMPVRRDGVCVMLEEPL